MLERVRDFRYEEIKNWKPIVSLRESYRRENSLRSGTLILTCFFSIAFFYALISGWIFQFQPLKQADRQAQETQPGDLPQTAASPLDSTDAGKVNATTNTSSPADRIGTTGSNSSEQYSQVAHSEGMTTPIRIAICDIRGILSPMVLKRQREWEQEAQTILENDRNAIFQRLDQLTETEVSLLYKIFDQKKRLAQIEIRQDCERLLRQYREQLQPILDSVGKEYDYDIILPAETVLAHGQSVDITQEVYRQFNQQRQAAFSNSGTASLLGTDSVPRSAQQRGNFTR